MTIPPTARATDARQKNPPRRRGRMKTMAQNGNGGTISPAVHLEFIENQLANGNGSGIEEVEQYHRALFLHHHAVEWEKYRQISKTHEDKLLFLEGRLKDN